MVPWLGRGEPGDQARSVVLPAPLSPVIASFSPAANGEIGKAHGAEGKIADGDRRRAGKRFGLAAVAENARAGAVLQFGDLAGNGERRGAVVPCGGQFAQRLEEVRHHEAG